MEKRLRSALRSSAEDFLAAALSESASKQLKPALKTLIWAIPASSDLCSSLPVALHRAASCLLDAFKDSLQPKCGDPAGLSPRSPPTKRRKKRSPSPAQKGAGGGALAQLRGLRTCAWIADLCVCHPRNRFSPSDLLPCVRALHDCLVLFEMDEALLCEVAGLCEKWWKENLQERETLISQSLPFLLSRSLTRNKKADVHRVYALRDAFSLFDFLDESIEDLRLLLVRCVITPLYLKTEEGRRFIAFTLGLNDQLLKEVLALIRSQIPFGRKTVLEAYADILFRAWKCSEGSLRGEIEDGFLQGLIEGAIYASSKSLATSIRRVLGVFLENRATEGVDRLLFRLVEPILFRSLQVANSNVRQNALHLLIDMFPLEDPDVIREVKNVLLDKQFFLLERLLVDDAPDVRTVAVEGCCRILHLFWEIIPSSTITRMLTKIVDDFSRDVCNDVKLSTLNGITYLLGNPQTHEILKVLIPRMGYMFLDPLLSVRLAVCDLLLAVRDIRNFQFNKVVSLDALLSSLADDHMLVARKITRLLMSSYFPSKIATKEACARFITLMKRSPAAGARFCEFALNEGSTSKSLVELLRVCFSLAISHKDLNSNQVDGLFVASANLCHALSSETSCKIALSKLFSKETLKSFLSTATSVQAQNSILSIASIVSPDDLGDFHDDCMKVIIKCGSLTDNEGMQTEVRRVHRLMVSNGWFDDLFGALADILQMASSRLLVNFGVESTNQAMSSKKKKRGKLPKKSLKNVDYESREKFSNLPEEDYATGAAAAWQVKDLVAYPETRDAVLNSSYLKSVSSSLSKIAWVGIEQSIHWELLDMSPILAYTSLCLYTSLQNVDSTVMEDPGSNGSFKTSSRGSILEGETLEELVNNLLNSAEKHLGYASNGKFCQSSLKVNQVEKSASNKRRKKKEPLENSSSPHEGVVPKDNSLVQTRMSNVLQITTALLKFIVDAATMRLISTGNKRWICFTSTLARYVISAMKNNQDDETSFLNWKENILCVKSAFSYAAKLLHVIISSYDQPLQILPEISCLANDLLDLIASVELHVGSGCASRIISVAKPWLPDLILGFSCSQLRDATQVENCPVSGSDIRPNFPVWLVLLSKVELCELRELNEDEGGNRYPDAGTFVFKKLIEMMILLLKRGNSKVLEAAGVMFLTFMQAGLEAEDFDMVLGLVHFICVKLVGEDNLAWSEFQVLYNCLQESYTRVECALTDLEHDENGREKLEIARELLSSHVKNH
ncbi:hypothetical protein Taro_002528, partial [Colocasia esculenta]|nr:hypothetical protein [Colocasia esculenta]